MIKNFLGSAPNAVPNQDALDLANKIVAIIAPLLYASAGILITFALLRFALKLHVEPQRKGEWVKQLFWSLFAVVIILSVTVVSHVLLAKFQGVM